MRVWKPDVAHIVQKMQLSWQATDKPFRRERNFPDTFFPFHPQDASLRGYFPRLDERGWSWMLGVSSISNPNTGAATSPRHCTASYCWARVPVGLSPSNEQSLGNWTPYGNDSPQETLSDLPSLS